MILDTSKLPWEGGDAISKEGEGGKGSIRVFPPPMPVGQERKEEETTKSLLSQFRERVEGKGKKEKK